MNLNLHIRAFPTVSALRGGTATQCIENTVIIVAFIDSKWQNKTALAVWVCLQIHIHQNINSFSINKWKKFFGSSVWSNSDARAWTVTKSSDTLTNISGELVASRKSYQLLISKNQQKEHFSNSVDYDDD